MSDQELLTGVPTDPCKRITALLQMFERSSEPSGLVGAAADTYPYVKHALIKAVKEDADRIAELEAQLEQVDLARKCLIYDNEKLQAKLDNEHEASTLWQSKTEALQKQLDAVRPYMKHHEWCKSRLMDECECGYTQELKKL